MSCQPSLYRCSRRIVPSDSKRLYAAPGIDHLAGVGGRRKADTSVQVHVMEAVAMTLQTPFDTFDLKPGVQRGQARNRVVNGVDELQALEAEGVERPHGQHVSCLRAMASASVDRCGPTGQFGEPIRQVERAERHLAQDYLLAPGPCDRPARPRKRPPTRIPPLDPVGRLTLRVQ